MNDPYSRSDLLMGAELSRNSNPVHRPKLCLHTAALSRCHVLLVFPQVWTLTIDGETVSQLEMRVAMV